MTTLEQELRAEARARHAELNFDGDLPIGDMLAMRAADEINRLSSKLATSEKDCDEQTEEILELRSRLDECRESCARAVASRDVAQSRLSSCMNQLRRVASAERRDAFGGVRVWLHSEWMREIDEIVFPKESVVERRETNG